MTLHLILKKFPCRIISKNGNVNCSPRSCDMTLLEYFIKAIIINHNQFLKLKDRIILVIIVIEPQLCQECHCKFQQISERPSVYLQKGASWQI